MEFVFIEPVPGENRHLEPSEPKQGRLWGIWVRVANIKEVKQFDVSEEEHRFNQELAMDDEFRSEDEFNKPSYVYEITTENGDVIKTRTNLITALKQRTLNPPEDDGSYDYPSL